MQKVISADGTPIAYDRIGTGPALIHVLGATATRGLSSERGDAGNDTHFTSYIYDRRGRGDSGDSAATPGHAIEREIDAAGGSAFVFGHSSGAVAKLWAIQ